MAHRADEKYLGTVTGGRLVESSKGTPGLQFDIEEQTMGDPISHTIWLSSKSKEYAEKDLEVLGITAAHRADASFWSYKVDEHLRGQAIAYGTKSEEYKGKTSIRVAWISKPRTSDGPAGERGLASAAASLFGGAAVEDKPDTRGENLRGLGSASGITDDEVPFLIGSLIPILGALAGIMA